MFVVLEQPFGLIGRYAVIARIILLLEQTLLVLSHGGY